MEIVLILTRVGKNIKPRHLSFTTADRLKAKLFAICFPINYNSLKENKCFAKGIKINKTI